MAQAAQNTPLDGVMNKDEKMQDSDSHIHPPYETRNEDAASSSTPHLRPLPERLPIDHNTDSGPEPIATATVGLEDSSSNRGFAQSVSGSTSITLTRAHWDASNLLGTQSHGEPKKACAMCAQHLE